MASLNIVNATVGLGAVKANFTNVGDKSTSEYYSQISTIVNYGSNNIYGVLANQSVPLTIATVTDSTNPVFTTQFNLVSSGIYSLYLVGQVGSIDTLLIKEVIPAYTDSLCGVRFINLSYNSDPIIITQAVTPSVNEFGPLTYKQYSAFKVYPATVASNNYGFQVRDASTNVVLGSYTLSAPNFHNVTLAWIGQAGAIDVNAPQVVAINQY